MPAIVLFTPVGWQVRDSETGDEKAAFGTGSEEYARAKARAIECNLDRKKLYLQGCCACRAPAMTRLLKILAWLAVFATALFIGHQNAAASIQPGVEHPELEAKLPTAVQVFVTDARPPAPDAMGWVWSLNGKVYPEIYLTPQTYLGITKRGPLEMFAFYHEWTHVAFQQTNERIVNTVAIAEFRYMLRHYWGWNAQSAQGWYNVVYNMAWSPDYSWVNYPENTVDPLLEAGY